MAEVTQLQDDLSFVRQAVERSGRQGMPPAAINYVWAAYVLCGYALLDLAPAAAGWFFMAGGAVGGVLSWVLGRRAAVVEGRQDREMGRRATLHWMAGVLLAIGSAIGFAVVMGLRGQAVGQLVVVMIGLVYFLAGVHFQRYFLWLGPVLIVGGLLVGYVPRYGWTGLGVVIAAGLVVPTLAGRRGKGAVG